jgi:predicted permease
LSNLLLLVVCFLIGILLARTERFPQGAAHALNAFVIYVSLPALILGQIHTLHLERSLIVPAAMPWLLFVIGAVIFRSVGRRYGLSRRTIGCLTLAAGLGNTSFVGIPMIEAYYGKDAVGVGLLADQLGSFLVLSTLGIFAAARYSSGTASLRTVMARVLRFPPFIALLGALILLPVPYPEPVTFLFARLGDTLAPLALVSVGLQLRFSETAQRERSLALGLGYKMLFGPALLLFLFMLIPGVGGRVLQVTIFEAAMPPMITGALVAIEYDLDPPLAALLLGVGIPFGFLTLWLWHLLLASVG